MVSENGMFKFEDIKKEDVELKSFEKQLKENGVVEEEEIWSFWICSKMDLWKPKVPAKFPSCGIKPRKKFPEGSGRRRGSLILLDLKQCKLVVEDVLCRNRQRE